MAITTTSTIGSDYTRPTVSTKSTLVVATAWTDRADLYCDQLTLRVNGYDTARLSFDFGAEIRQPNDQSGSVGAVSPLDIKGQFVRVTQGSFNWYGYIVGEDKDRMADASGALLGNRQYFTAVGLAYFLDRAPIRVAYIHNASEIQRALVFNGGDQGHLMGFDPKSRGNMHPADDANGYRSFYDPQDTASPAELWSATNILDHVLTYHGPRDAAGTRHPAFLRAGGEAAFLDDWFPTVRTENRTAMEVLNSICNPQRGLCWWAYYEDDDTAFPTGIVRVTLNSLNVSDISLNVGAGTLPQNNNKETLNFDADNEVLRPRISKPLSRAYTRVVCRGARQTGTGTFGVPDSTLQGNWDAAFDEVAYRAGASSTTGYSSLTTEQKQKRNDAMRRQEEFSRVFSSFAIPNDWDGLVGDGLGGVTDAALFPELSGSTPVGRLEHYWPGLRVLPHLLIDPTGSTPDSDDPEYMAPFAIVRVATSPNRYQFADKLTDADFAAGTKESDADLYSYHLHPEADVFGIRLRSSRGLNHTLAKGDWTSAEPTGVEPQLDWTTVRATLSVEADAYCEGFWPTPPSNVPIEELIIDMGDNYRLDYLVAGTVIGLDEGQDVNASATLLRDDRNQLTDFAQFAYEWYRAERRTLDVAFARIDVTNFDLGMMITTVGSGSGVETVNTVIGVIAYDFDQGVTSIQTIPANLDLPELLS